ncbi:ABC-2 type transport system permease protein [Lacibacter cauensis]|uniref:ABC-2 type transport system permease protein n=1 Tax=Lacibacter cauensis TaxID=510947 RepID=A0A562SJ61_9BACT|nr:gliding motility-associated ABC transporter permease subunit GldF [Lacibacter cauensis]TWI81262.1 ABC-2 type transport system permease protein [Lacibacter cauensis]
MWAICKKEFRQFFSNLTGYITIILFLLLNGLFLFVFSSFNILDYGYATLENFFSLAPYILLLLIPAVTMRLFPDEKRAGTLEILFTRPLTARQIVMGKFIASLIVVLIALLPTLTYLFTIKAMSAEGTVLDMGGITGSYIGLLFLSAAFTAIGLCSSSFTDNPVVAFLLSAFLCFALYSGFGALSKLVGTGADYIVETIGMEFHYRSLSKGVIDSRDLIYFLSIICFTLFITIQRIGRKN